jgi:biotin carboxylase
MLLTVGAVNDALGLRGVSEAAARRCVDKLLFHETMRAAGVSAPAQETAEAGTDIRAAAARLGYPVVVKPRAGSGSRGLFVARDQNELDELLPLHFAARRGLLESASALVQRFIDGQEVGVDAVMNGGVFTPLLIRDKNLTALPFRAGYGYLTPTSLGAGEVAGVWEAVGRAVAAIGLRDCLLHADIIVDAQSAAHIIEMSGRPSGYNLCLRMVPAVVGVDAVAQTIRLVLGEPVSFEPTPPRGGVLRMLSAPVGRIRAVRGLDDALRLPGVIDGACFLRSGQFVAPRRDGPSSYVGYLLTAAPTREEAERIWREAAALVEFDVEPAEAQNS